MRGTIVVVLALVAMVSCQPGSDRKRVHAAYYWSTVFATDSVKAHFYRTQQIRKLYVRYFDVVKNKSGEAVPNATIMFQTVPPNGVEVVPTVFITNDCMQSTPLWTEKLLRRILQMNKTNGITGVREIQIDCDWTPRTQAVYFSFLQQLRRLAAQKHITLSATIRLHQLAQAVPPIEKGTLMLYNTGDFRDIQCEKPILDNKDVKPYLRFLKRYALPMNAAYPIFRWQLLFRKGNFVGIIHGKDEYPILPTDTVVMRKVTLTDLQEVQHSIENVRPELHNEIILFDANTHNITQYLPAEYEKMYHP